MLAGAFFIVPSLGHAVDSDIVITEIGAYEKTDHEWIEIYNKGSESVSLSGWKFYENFTNHGLSAFRGDLIIEPREYAVIADVASITAVDHPEFTGTLIDSSWSTLSLDGEPIGMRDSQDIFIELFNYLSMQRFSLERKDPQLPDYTSANWAEHTTGNSIGKKNSSTPASEQAGTSSSTSTVPLSSSETTFQTVSSSPSATSSTTPSALMLWKPGRSDVVINEFVADPSDGEKEWIELYNTSGNLIDLSGWAIHEGSGSVTQLSGILGTSGPARFLVIENPAGNLNNGGDSIVLRDKEKQSIDTVSYGSWDDGNLSNNAPAAADPYAVARVNDGTNSYNNAFDFAVTTRPTKGASNSIVASDNETPKKEEKKIPTTLIISELFPNPSQSVKDEYIELYNNGSEEIDLSGWEIGNELGQRYQIRGEYVSSTRIDAGEFMVFFRSTTQLALKNTGGESIKLFHPEREKGITSVSFKQDAIADASYARDANGTYQWTLARTPGKPNVIQRPNHPPTIVVDVKTRGIIGEELVFDARDSVDLDGDTIGMTWDFGDGTSAESMRTTHQYREEGRYAVVISASDGKEMTKETRTVIVSKEKGKPVAPPQRVQQDIQENSSAFVLNELFPNPKGADTKEFIEIKNISSEPQEIPFVRIRLGNGKEYTIAVSSSQPIAPGGVALIALSDSTLRLRNTEETVLLLNAQGYVLDDVKYEDAPSGQTLARTDTGEWIWTSRETPGSVNRIFAPWLLNDEETAVHETVADEPFDSTRGEQGFELSVPAVFPAEARQFDVGEEIIVTGIVVVPPGLFGKNTLYLDGIGVYGQTNVFSSQKIGLSDRVKIQGVIGTRNGEKQLRIPKNGSIRILGKANLPAPKIYALSEIDETLLGSFVRVKGDVVDSVWPNIFLEDGSEEIKISVKRTTGIKRMPLHEGDALEVSGIVSMAKDGYRIFPRFAHDLTVYAATTTLGYQEKITIPSRARESQSVGAYLIATLVALVIVSIGLFLQYRKK